MTTREIVVADIGGTHARFALAAVTNGRIGGLSREVVPRVAEHSSLQTAWEAFGRIAGCPLPDEAAIAVACPVGRDVLELTNNPWIVRPATFGEQLGVRRYSVINDFAAVAHAVAVVDRRCPAHLCGPDRPLAAEGVISVLGPGTGLGVATLLRQQHCHTVVATEGGHTDFAPLDAIEDQLLARLRPRFRRVSVERVVSGRGLVDLYMTLAAIEDRAVREREAPELWAAALAGEEALAAAALDRFCSCLGAVAGDIALVQGGFGGVVLAGGLGLRLADHLPRSGFQQRFIAKGRFETLMATIPVKILTHPQPGLLGAAAAYIQDYP